MERTVQNISRCVMMGEGGGRSIDKSCTRSRELKDLLPGPDTSCRRASVVNDTPVGYLGGKRPIRTDDINWATTLNDTDEQFKGKAKHKRLLDTT